MESDVAKYLDELTTEQPNPHSLGIDTKSTVEILKIINREDSKVPEAIRRQIPAIVEVIEVVVERFRRGDAFSTWVPGPLEGSAFWMPPNAPRPSGPSRKWCRASSPGERTRWWVDRRGGGQ